MWSQLIESCPYKLHTIAKNYTTNEKLFAVRPDESFSSASVIKVPILIAALYTLQHSGRSLQEKLPIDVQNIVDFSVLTEQQLTETTLYEALVWMIITSDNSATNVCIDYVGMDALNTFFAKQGWNDTKVLRKMMDFERQQAGFDNVTSAADCEQMFAALYYGTILNEQMNKLALQILCRQRSHESLRRYIVDDIKVAHKTGGLDTVDHDVGLFFTKTADYFIGIFVTEVKDNERAKRYIGQLSKAVYTKWTKG